MQNLQMLPTLYVLIFLPFFCVIIFRNQSFVCFSFNFLQLLPKQPFKKTPKITPQNNHPKLALIHAHKMQDLAEINIVSNMKRVKTKKNSSKLVQFSKQISNVNILAPVWDNPSKFSLRGRPESWLSLSIS